MDERQDLLFLFAMVKEMKRSFENPVILLTMKDYADDIFNTLVDLRALLQRYAKPGRIAGLVETFHINWLQAVQDIENFKKRSKETPREVVKKSILYTIECLNKRHTYFKKYIENIMTTMPETETAILQADLDIIKDMQEIATFSLMEKQKIFDFSVDKTEFHQMILYEIEELLNWLDRLYDYLSVQCTKVLDLGVPTLITELTKTLQKIIDRVARCSIPEPLAKFDDICSQNRTLSYLGRMKSSINDKEINKVADKIKELEERISRMKMKMESSPTGIMALEHKTIYLEERLESLEHLKISLNFLRCQNQIKAVRKHDPKGSIKERDVRIFNHLLSLQERSCLTEKLVELWQFALGEHDGKSYVSILSAPELREVFSDEIGLYAVDKYGRKIYRISSQGSSNFYQLNENNQLVPVNDDEKHIYYYDACGRYYLDEDQVRIYKANSTASEYLLHRTGLMLKVGEVIGNVEYKYDNLGRYYTDDHGDRIYRDRGSSEEYRPDGLGNLVKIRHKEICYEYCPVEPSFIEESKYLKEVVGTALRKCVAEVVLAQPTDPVKYLADLLENYRNNIEKKQKRIIDEQLMMTARENLPKDVSELQYSSHCEAESNEDINFKHYVSSYYE